MKKRILALALAGIMALSLCACGGGNGGRFVADESLAGPLTKDDVIILQVESSSSWPVQEDWKIWEYMAEGSGATLDIKAIPASDAGTKYPIMFAAREELPDLIGFSGPGGATKFAGQGLIALDDLAMYMPTYNAWLDSLTEDEYAVVVKPRKFYDGKIYYTPGTGREGKTRMSAWLYREDIFKKHNLKAPTTYDELYEVCKTLKGLYPDSYPYCTRSLAYMFDLPGSSFDKWWKHGVYYDFDEEKWKYGTMEKETTLEIIEFNKKMIDEKLMPADMATLATTTHEELWLTDRAFIMPHLQLRIDFFNSRGQLKNPDYKVQAFPPPVANPEKGAPMVERGDIEQIGLSICDSGRAQSIANAAKFVDWMYTDEAMELVSWGKEGETYEVVDGKKKFITDEKGSQPNTLYGFQLYGSFCRLDPLAAEAVQSDITLESEDIVLESALPYHPVTEWLTFNEEEQQIIDIYSVAIRTESEEKLLKFVLGQEPLSNYDAFMQTLEEMGVNELLGAYESAYNRAK